MTDITGITNDDTFIWDSDLSKFVPVSSASTEQIRLYGTELYTLAGSGRVARMQPINPTGAEVVYSISESNRRGERVTAGRAAGRAGAAVRRQQQRAERERLGRSVAIAQDTAAVRRSEFDADMAERRQKIEALQVDFQNETLWQEMNAYTKQLLYSDPSLLEDIELRGGLDTATVMDYVFFGTPRSPGLFMEGVSNEYVWIPELRRFKNAMFASEEERMNSKVYTRDDVDNAERLGQFEPLGETLEREILEPARAVGRAIERALPGWFGSPDEFENFPNFPDNVFRDQRRINRSGVTEVVKVANPDVLGPWITSNYETLTPKQQRKIDDLVETSQATYAEDVAATMSPEERRMARNRGYNPWDAIDNRRQEIQTQQQLTPEARQQQTEEQRLRQMYEVSPERRAVGVEEEQQRANVMRRSALLQNIEQTVRSTIASRYLDYEFTSVPLGFSPDEFVQTTTSLLDDPRYKQLSEDILRVAQEGGDVSELIREQTNLSRTFRPETFYVFRQTPGTVPFTDRDLGLLETARELSDVSGLSQNQQLRNAQRARSVQRSAARGVKPLSEGEAYSRLRNISRDPVAMSQLKQRLLLIPGANESNYATDTSMDGHTVALWEQAVAMANNEGVDPEFYLAQLSLDPIAQERARSAARNYSGGGATFTIRLPSTDDVATIVQDVAYRRIGQRLDSAQAQQVAQAYVQMAESQYRSQQGATTVTEPMSAETFAQQQISQQYGPDEMVYQTGLQLDTLIEMIGG